MSDKLRALIAKWRSEVEARHNSKHSADSCPSCQQHLADARELEAALGEPATAPAPADDLLPTPESAKHAPFLKLKSRPEKGSPAAK